MNNSKPHVRERAGANPWRWVVLASGCILFGIIMSVRAEQGSIWVRAFIAGCAFVVLGLAISQFRKLGPGR